MCVCVSSDVTTFAKLRENIVGTIANTTAPSYATSYWYIPVVYEIRGDVLGIDILGTVLQSTFLSFF